MIIWRADEYIGTVREEDEEGKPTMTTPNRTLSAIYQSRKPDEGMVNIYR